jgi:MoxR-like ATPase
MPSPSEIKTLVKTYHRIKRSMIILGPPGGGKSACVEQAAREIATEEGLSLFKRTFTQKEGLIESFDPKTQFGFFDVRLAMLDAVDGRGIPVFNRENYSTAWPPPEWLPRGGCGILFLDEFLQGTPLVQNAFSQPVYDGTMGEYVLPPGWSIVMASNRSQDRAGTHEMPSHLRNKIGQYDFDTDLDEWMDWAFDNGIMPEIVGLIKSRPELLHAFDAKEKAFPSPRSWELASEVLTALGQTPRVPSGLAYEGLKAHVGTGAAVEASAFMDVFHDLPDFDDIMADPEGFPVPELAATTWATTMMLGHRSKSPNFPNAVKYIARFQPEYVAVFINYISRNRKELAEQACFGELMRNAKL